MALTGSNTFVLTGAGNSIATSRIHLNGSLQALVQSFYSSSPPAAINYKDAAGSNVTVDADAAQGILYRSSTFNALYINDKGTKKNGEGPGANWNRVGLGTRYENTLATATPGNYQIGELFVTVGGGVGTANARLYMKSSNNVGAADFKDVGLPHPLSVETGMYIDRSVSNTKIALASITSHEIQDRAISNVDIGAVSITEHELADDSVTLAKIAGNAGVPSGCIFAYGATSAPAGFTLCDGSALSRSTYSGLFAIIGTSFGTGNGNNTFNVPSFADRLPLGKGTNNSTLGAQTGSMSASSTVTSTSFTPSSHSTSSTTIATASKDVGSASVLSGVADHASLTATSTIPTVVVQWIIKT